MTTGKMLGESKCPVEKRQGGATKFEAGKTCEAFKSSGWVSEKTGCCYEEGTGQGGKPCCHKAHEKMTEGKMLGESSCPKGQRLGGSTKFEAGKTCEAFKAS